MDAYRGQLREVPGLMGVIGEFEAMDGVAIVIASSRAKVEPELPKRE